MNYCFVEVVNRLTWVWKHVYLLRSILDHNMILEWLKSSFAMQKKSKVLLIWDHRQSPSWQFITTNIMKFGLIETAGDRLVA